MRNKTDIRLWIPGFAWFRWCNSLFPLVPSHVWGMEKICSSVQTWLEVKQTESTHKIKHGVPRRLDKESHLSMLHGIHNLQLVLVPYWEKWYNVLCYITLARTLSNFILNFDNNVVVWKFIISDLSYYKILRTSSNYSWMKVVSFTQVAKKLQQETKFQTSECRQCLPAQMAGLIYHMVCFSTCYTGMMNWWHVFVPFLSL